MVLIGLIIHPTIELPLDEILMETRDPHPAFSQAHSA
jgi:hypothetical protein